MDVVAFIPVRGGSKSIPLKNIKPLGGRPLVHWTMLAALECGRFQRVFVATEDDRIREVAGQIRDPRLEIVDRDPLTATDTASTESALLDFARARSFNKIALIQATSPLVTGEDLKGAIEKMVRVGADSILSVTREHRFRWRSRPDGGVEAVNYDPLRRPRRQDWDGELLENGAFYITTRAALLSSGCRLSGRIESWEMGRESALELDEPEDWADAEKLLARRGPARDIEKRAQAIDLIVTDVDGVLTDAGMYYGPDGERLKKFNTRDGMGIELWRKAGYRVAIMTGERTPIVEKRAAKLKIDRVEMGVSDKASAIEKLAREEALDLENIAFLGDDINDLDAMGRVGLAAAPADASAANKAVAHYVCAARGGGGCLRELIELLLRHKKY